MKLNIFFKCIEFKQNGEKNEINEIKIKRKPKQPQARVKCKLNFMLSH